MTNSILQNTKKVLGIAPDYTVFDEDILMHINTTLGTLTQIGLGPAEGFRVQDADATWEDFLGDDLRLLSVKTYVYLRVRLLFDPPATSFTIEALERQLREIEWRLSVTRESDAWIDPDPPHIEDVVYDGGTP